MTPPGPLEPESKPACGRGSMITTAILDTPGGVYWDGGHHWVSFLVL